MAYPLREPLPHRRDARDVHARRLHARRRARPRTGSFLRGVRRRRRPSAADSTCRATTAPTSPIRDMPRALAGSRAASTRPTSASSPASRSCPSRRARSEPSASAEPYLVRGSDAASSRTRPTGSPRRARATAPPRAVWNALRAHPDLAVVDALIVAPQRELELRRRRPTSRLHGFYLEDETFDPGPGRRARPADRQRAYADRDRRARPTPSRSRWPGIWTSQPTLRPRSSATARVPTVAPARARARRRPGRGRDAARVAPSSRTAWRPSRCEQLLARRRLGASYTFNRLHRWASWASA